MLRRLRKVDADTWVGVVSYLGTVFVLYRVTDAAVAESAGALIFAMFMGLGAAVPVYLVARFIFHRVVRLYRSTRPPSAPAPVAAKASIPADGRPEKRFRLARHGSIDPAYGRQTTPDTTAPGPGS